MVIPQIQPHTAHTCKMKPNETKWNDTKRNKTKQKQIAQVRIKFEPSTITTSSSTSTATIRIDASKCLYGKTNKQMKIY